MLFADTFYFLALMNKKDEAHAKAVQYTASIEKIVTTEWVLTELADALASSKQRVVFQKVRTDLLANKDVLVVPLDMKLYAEGINFYTARPDKEWSLTDCISFLVMQREGIREALTGDHHFEQAGFIGLLK